MTHMPATRDPQPLWKSTNRRAKSPMAERFESILNSPDLPAIALFCAVGLLVTVLMILWTAGFGTVAEQFGQFP